MKCKKCGTKSGDDWKQCFGYCPMPSSPYYASDEVLDMKKRQDSSNYSKRMNTFKTIGFLYLTKT